MSETVFYWFGLAHAVGYSAVGSVVGFVWCFNLFAKKTGAARDMIRIYARYLNEKHRRDRDASEAENAKRLSGEAMPARADRHRQEHVAHTEQGKRNG